MFSVVQAGYTAAWQNLAFDEALVRAGPDRPTVWLWRNRRCVVLGRGQRAEREVDLAACSAAGVPVLRRGSGGGTVYHDEGNLNITLAAPRDRDAFAVLGAVLVNALAAQGLTARLGRRGVFLGSEKLCGFAALRTATGVLAHASMLCSTPPGPVSRYLAGAPTDPGPLDSERSPVTSLVAHGATARPERFVLAAMAEEFGSPRHRAASEPERRQQALLAYRRYGFGPWHLTGQQNATKEKVWTPTPEWTCTG